MVGVFGVRLASGVKTWLPRFKSVAGSGVLRVGVILPPDMYITTTTIATHTHSYTLTFSSIFLLYYQKNYCRMKANYGCLLFCLNVTDERCFFSFFF